MKRISILTGLMLGLIIAALGLLHAHAPASAGYGFEYKCYKDRVVESSTRELKQIYISDQFEEKNLILRTPIMYCSFVFGSQSPNPLLCYSIKDAPGQPRFLREEILTSDRFHDLDVQVTQPYALCESSKQVGVSLGGAEEQNVSFPRLKCYRVRRTEHGRLDSDSAFVTDKFGGKTVRVSSPVLFCTEVFEKKHSAKNDAFGQARTISGLPFEDHVSTLTSTHPRTDPVSSCGQYAHSVWYQYTPGEKETAYISTADSTYATFIGVFTGGKGNFDEVDCESHTATPGLEVNLKAGITYWIVVGSAPQGLGGKLKFNFDVEATCASDCADPEPDPDAEAAAQATPERPGAELQVPENNLMCYAISQRGPDAEVDLENQFGLYTLALGRATLFCVDANKCRFALPVSTSAAVGDAVQVAGCG